MSYFNQQNIPVEHEGNTVWVLPKIGQGVNARIQANIRLKMFGLNPTDDVYHNAFLRNCIVKWDGPAFKGENGKTVPCTPENIDEIPIDDPLMVKAIEKINELNRKPEDIDPVAEVDENDPNG